MMLYEDTDSCLLRLIECFMEAAPQLVLQLYIMCVLGAEDGIIVCKLCYTRFYFLYYKVCTFDIPKKCDYKRLEEIHFNVSFPFSMLQIALLAP